MAIWSFTKAKRAQSVDDDETWIEGGVVPTLNAFDLGDTRTTVIIIDGTRVGDVRVYEDDVMQTVIQRWGTGGGNVPYVLGTAVSYDEYNDKLGGDIHHSLRAGTPQSTGVLITPQPAEEDDNMPVLMRERFGGDEGGQGHLLSDNISLTLSPTNFQTLFEEEEMPDSIVRRLTPIECERLQGFPDDWTAQRYDYKKQQIVDQADSNRYKQMGNAVAVPVVDWIVNRLVAIDADDRQA